MRQSLEMLPDIEGYLGKQEVRQIMEKLWLYQDNDKFNLWYTLQRITQELWLKKYPTDSEKE